MFPSKFKGCSFISKPRSLLLRDSGLLGVIARVKADISHIDVYLHGRVRAVNSLFLSLSNHVYEKHITYLRGTDRINSICPHLDKIYQELCDLLTKGLRSIVDFNYIKRSIIDEIKAFLNILDLHFSAPSLYLGLNVTKFCTFVDTPGCKPLFRWPLFKRNHLFRKPLRYVSFP